MRVGVLQKFISSLIIVELYELKMGEKFSNKVSPPVRPVETLKLRRVSGQIHASMAG